MNDFYKFYEETYHDFQKFLIIKSPKLDKVDDLLQEAYLKVYTQSKKKKILDEKAYLFQVGWNLLKKEYKLKEEFSLEENIKNASIRIEEDILNQITLEQLWDSIQAKDIRIQKCIYLYYLGMSIEEISSSLNLNRSNVKNYLYRTFKELREEFL